jgi:hypothetical protein
MWRLQDRLPFPDLLPGLGCPRSPLQAAPSGFSASSAAAVSRSPPLQIRVLRLQPSFPFDRVAGAEERRFAVDEMDIDRDDEHFIDLLAQFFRRAGHAVARLLEKN